MISPCELCIQNKKIPINIPRISHVFSIRSSFLPFFRQHFLNIHIYIYVTRVFSWCPHLSHQFIPLPPCNLGPASCCTDTNSPLLEKRPRVLLAPAPHSPASPGHLGFSKRGDQVIYQAPSKKNHRKRCPKLENPNFEIAICSWCFYMFLYVSIFLVGCKMDSVVCPLDSCQWVIVINEW